ncbi:MAG: hypothetical protein PUB66_09305 [Oscillospiraceae bacterium]|nr:hypothetical protein [Oscillospiraceae bacterium]
MKKNNIILLTAFMAAGVFLTSCDTEKVPSVETTAETTTAIVTTVSEKATEPTTEAPTEPEMKIIGKKAEGEHIYSVKLKNSTGKEILGFAVKDSSKNEFSENMLNNGESFAKGEEQILYYDAADAITANEYNVTDSDIVLTPEYTIQLTFADGTVAELHQFPFDDVESAEIYTEDDIAYLIYTSVSSKTEVNTKEAEKMQAQGNTDTEPAVPNDNDVTIDYSYQEPVYEQPNESYEAPAEQPVENTPAEEAPVENNNENSEPDPNSGCLGGEGLFN